MTHPVHARYGTQGGPAVDLNETLQVILGHASCRHYTAHPVADETLDLLVAAAQSAPTSSNLQCWSVVAVTDPAHLTELSALCGHQKHIAAAPMMLCFMADLARVERIARGHGLPVESLDHIEMSILGVIDAALAAQNLVTAAASMGLGTCYIGGLRNDIGAVRRSLDLPDRIMPVFGLTLGRPDPARPASVKPRLPARAVLHRDVFAEPAYDSLIPDYDATLAQFNQGQGRQVDPWSLLTAKRVATVERMDGRDRLLSLMQDIGLARR